MATRRRQKRTEKTLPCSVRFTAREIAGLNACAEGKGLALATYVHQAALNWASHYDRDDFKASPQPSPKGKGVGSAG
ncbi:MAG: hypothetical protein IKN59_06145 [Paludibacteraceae bacterium]|nr:hypothetical protein [Paludibacteraceae bacterium]